MKLKTKTKERLITWGCVALICIGGISTSGCSTLSPLSPLSPSQRSAQRSAQQYWDSICTTDSDCEMHHRQGTRHRNDEDSGLRGWRLWTSIGIGVLVTGYLYAQRQDNGASSSSRGIDVRTPGVGCVAAGCAQ